MSEALTARTKVTGWAMVAAPITLLASTVVSVAGNGLTEDAAGGAIQFYAVGLLIVAIVGLTARLASAYPRVSAALLLAGVIGWAAGISWAIDKIQIDLRGAESLAELDSASVALTLLLPGILGPLVLAVIGIALARARIEPVWGVVLAVAAVSFPMGRIPEIDALAILTDVLFVVALAPMGLAMARTSGTKATVAGKAVAPGLA